MITRAQLQQFFTGVAMIMLFIAIKKSPLDGMTSWIVWGIASILLFTFSPTLAKKLKRE